MTSVVHMPSLRGATAWLNSEPLETEALRGRVVLVDFWTLTCINWLRTEPYIRAWSQAYRDDGLVVIGVHTPEFSFEREIDRIGGRSRCERSTTRSRSTTTTAVWSGVRQPLLAGALLRRQGGRHPRPALRRRPLRGVRAVDPGAARRPARARLRRRGRRGGRGRLGAPAHARDVPGLRRSESFASPAAPRSTNAALRAPTACASTTGRWPASGRSGARTSSSSGPAGASPTASTRATRISCCRPERASRSRSACCSTARRPGASHGVDVDADGNGVLGDGRLYQLVRQHDAVRERTLEITFLEPGAEAYAFTFG